MQDIKYTDKFVNPMSKLKTLRKDWFPDGQASVTKGWGYEVRKSKLWAVRFDEYENLHSLIEDDTCSCGLVIDLDIHQDLDAILKVKGHRDHHTLQPIEYVTFRGTVHKRLWGLNGYHPVDKKWNQIVKKSFPKIVFAVEGEVNGN
jgi:hypothetical protein